MIKLEFYDPSGTMEIAQPHAPRLTSLEGKRIGIVSNDHWQAHRMLPLLKTWLEEDFPGAEVLPVDAFPHGSAAGRDAAVRYLRAFIEDIKASGLVAATIERNGITGVSVAPSAPLQ